MANRQRFLKEEHWKKIEPLLPKPKPKRRASSSTESGGSGGNPVYVTNRCQVVRSSPMVSQFFDLC